MSDEQKSPGGCAAIVALTIVAFIGIFVWSQISAGCSSPKKARTSSSFDVSASRAIAAGEKDGREIAASLAQDGGTKITNPDQLMLLAQTRARITKVEASQVYDWTKGFCAGYSAEMNRLGK